MAWQLVLMDIDMPGMNGIDGTREPKAVCPDLSVIMLTVFEEPNTILQAICASADGYLLKKSSAEDLLAAARSILGGGSPLTSGVARTVLGLLRNGDSRSNGLSARTERSAPSRLDLTGREQDVLRCFVAHSRCTKDPHF